MELTTELTTTSVLLLGFVLGLHHAIEADHLAAVSAIVSEKKNIFTASIVGGLWGVGHTLSLFVVGLLVIFLKLQISESVESKLEGVVGVMLVLLGLNAIYKLLRSDKVHSHEHSHDGLTHTHPHTHEANEDENASHHRLSPRSVLVGMIHGLAGSAALMLMIVPLIPSAFVALLYIVVFGVGSIAGMMAMSLLIGLPFHFTAARHSLLNAGIRVAAGLFSLALGSSIIYEHFIAA
ncbi:MAG: high-affinity nickel-transporter [Acidobacteria bacterium OLB17]|nr:MAG: high-affinity nickel-transporter [Acidobacteria bacterium OLB17]MCZ2390696.1 urease accessory protein UreH [Acidobacteriota bacterium]